MKNIIPCFLLSFCFLSSCKEETKKYDPAKKYKIEAKHSQKNLTLSYNRPLQTVSDTTHTAFKWQIRYLADSSVQIISLPSGQSIELADVQDQVLPYIADADSNNTRQKFIIAKDEDGSVYLESVFSKYCIDVSESDTSDFPVITTWPKESNPNQKWKMQPAGDAVVFTTLLNGKYLAVTPTLKEEGANIGQWPFVGRDEQIWTIQQLENGTYTIRNAFSGMYLQEADGKLSLKYNVHQASDASIPASQWHLDELEDGFIKLRNAASGYCLDVRDGVPFDGANVMTYDCVENLGGGDNQHWKIKEITEK